MPWTAGGATKQPAEVPESGRPSRVRDALCGSGILKAELQFLAALVDGGELYTFIDREYPLDRMVEAHTDVQQGHKRGHVVINVTPAS
ncbi:MAG TPA: zinc-binding dehydrogenase [Gammaproteobacteria bacterium]|nr:zinc-binding dehydrogenase [Gammaproteobacteria bacterium]